MWRREAVEVVGFRPGRTGLEVEEVTGVGDLIGVEAGEEGDSVGRRCHRREGSGGEVSIDHVCV